MTLYDILRATQYNQKFFVYVTNIYDQNIPIGIGVRAELLNEDENDTFDYLSCKVDQLNIARDGKSLVVRVIDGNFEKKAEELYSEEYVKKWDNLRPETRPWKHSAEMEDF